MSYSDHKSSVLMTTSAGVAGFSATASGDKATYVCLYPPGILRRVGFIHTVSGVTSSGVVVSIRRKTSHVASTTATICTINGTANGDAGRVLLSTGLSASMGPGNEVVFHVSTGKTNLRGRAFVYFEPRWETPTNLTRVYETT